ncbi:MAG: hypothetical protein WC916_06215 [Candidatus Woesearchaeota archaeon]
MGIYRKRMVSERFAQKLRAQGFLAIDTHAHTSYSYDVASVKKTSPEVVTNAERSKGLIPVITDHDTMDGYRYLRSKRLHRDIIPAVEIRIKPVHARKISGIGKIHTLHVNVFGLNMKQFRILEHIAQKEEDIDAFINYLRDEQLKWTYNHPFWHENHEKLNWRAVPLLARHYFDILEINSNRSLILNNLTMNIAEKLGKGIVASTDTHTGNPGLAYVLAPGKTFDECWNNIIQRKMYIVRKDLTALMVVREASEIISQIFSANSREMQEKKFSMASGIKPLDRLASRVSYGNLKNHYAIKHLIKNALHAINYSVGPLMAWYLYTHKQDVYGQRIHRPIMQGLRQKNIHPMQEFSEN